MDKTLWLRWRYPILVFFLGAIAIVYSSQPISLVLFKHEVEKRLENIHLFYQERYLNLGQELVELAKELRYTCNQHDIALLRDTIEQSSGIQLLELQTPTGDCSVYGKNVRLIKDFDDSSASIHHENDLFNYSVSPYHNHRLKVQYRLPDAKLTLITEPVQNVFTQSEVCFGCTAMTLGRDGEEIDVFPRLDKKQYTHIASKYFGPNYAFNVYATESGITYVTESDLFITQLLLFFMLLSACLMIGLYRTPERTLKEMISYGLMKKEFIPYYQPIVDSTTGAITCCEVLIRWQRSDGELISPNQFIPIAEHNGQIKLLTNYIIEHVIDQFEGELIADSQFYISINVTPQQLEDDEFLSTTINLLKQRNVPAHRLAFEVTERIPFSDLAKARRIIQHLTDFGISIKLDDAGTGYGGFSYLQNLPIDTLKIDKMFVDTIGTNDIKSNILDSIILFAKHAGLKVIAEGVETKAQVDYLHQREIYLMQGYHYAKPMPFNEFKQYLQQDLMISKR
ncbi:EAL domain-containing protein [Photobacterium rosenbergii]|uniref:EAL domain-containing protein n=1 Tax=Photobacterium rosenbergii TaxID=294936 RepID=A0A2T3NG82_9GAMM|nr:EAL domain-containing protein [Photobacterium rosenbergii]PSW13569.1 EAL domain-containing protein [Photobacterium rosenbergii]